jgi:tRNA-specific adenosine deaminase 1
MPPLAESIALTALARFDSLPSNCKPRTLSHGVREWTPMTAVVLAQGEDVSTLTCVSLATGTKCLSTSALPKCNGLVLHDSHAEILALRGLNSWLLAEVLDMTKDPTYHSPYLQLCPDQDSPDAENDPTAAPRRPFKIKDNISIHLFTTEAPCGDASMEILMDSLPPGQAVPWPSEPDSSDALRGRGHFSQLGQIRRKPARADAEPSLSKSCSDKLAVKQYTGILSFPADLYILPTQNIYIRSLVVYSDQYHAAAYARAFGPSGRLSHVVQPGHFFVVDPLPKKFAPFVFAKQQQSAGGRSAAKLKTSNIAALLVRGNHKDRRDAVEVLINGVKQGYKQFEPRPKKASLASRDALWQLGLEISSLWCSEVVSQNFAGRDCSAQIFAAIHTCLSSTTYRAAKLSSLRRTVRDRRSSVTQAMGNWVSNHGDEGWSRS